MTREWMYRRFSSDGYISREFQQGLESFIHFACSQPAYMDGDKIRCPCRKCKNMAYMDVDTIRLHICSKGFEFNYHVWRYQGERQPMGTAKRPTFASTSNAGSQYRQMAREKNIPVGETSIPTFKKFHFSHSEQTYTSGKAKRIAEEVEAQVADLNQHLPEGVDPSAEDTTSIFVRVAQDPAKHRVFGLGSLYTPDPVEFSRSSQPSVSSSTQMHPALAEMQAKMKEDREDMDARLAAEQAARENMDARLAAEQAARLELLGEFSSLKEMYRQQQEMYRQQQLLIQRLINEKDTPEDD